MLKTLKTITINNKDYTYIHTIDKDGKEDTTVAGVIITIQPDTVEKLNHVKGFFGNLLEPLLKNTDKDIEKVLILGLTRKGMEQFTGIYFYNSENIIYQSLTNEPSIVSYLSDQLTEKDVSYEEINSLEYLRDHPNEKINHLLDKYYSPRRIDDTGLYIDNEMVYYGDELEVKNIPKMVKDLELEHTSIHKIQPSRLLIKISDKGPRMMGSIGRIEFEKNGKPLTDNEGYFYSGMFDTGETDYEKFVEKEKMDLIHATAIRINKALSIRTKEKHARTIEYYSRDLTDSMMETKDPFVEVLLIRVLNAMLEGNHLRNISKRLEREEE